MLNSSGGTLQEHLPLRLARKLHATLQHVDVLFTAEELETLRGALLRLAGTEHDLPPVLLDDLRRQVDAQLDWLQEE